LARRKDDPADTLEELESLGERLATWAAVNSRLVLGTAAVILVVAAAYGGYRAWSASREASASEALASIQSELAVALGGSPTDLQLPEPANPETARQVRTEFAERLSELGRQHEGTAAGALARLQAGDLYERVNDPERALAAWDAGIRDLSSGSPLAAILHSRRGYLFEQEGQFAEAAREHEAAGAVEAYPLRYQELGAAVRCWLDAGQPDTALALYQRIQKESPDTKLPPYVESQMQELQASRGDAPRQEAPSAPDSPHEEVPGE
jgi:tetratricopeptide (TPR) repeat protein